MRSPRADRLRQSPCGIVKVPSITAARGHRIGVGDLILSRHNDASIPLRNNDDPAAEHSPVRNGQRWQVTRINPDNNRVAARRLEDNTLAVFSNDYVREHITYGYAVTAYSAQGITADTTHAVLSETATRALTYVAMTAAATPTPLISTSAPPNTNTSWIPPS